MFSQHLLPYSFIACLYTHIHIEQTGPLEVLQGVSLERTRPQEDLERQRDLGPVALREVLDP